MNKRVIHLGDIAKFNNNSLSTKEIEELVEVNYLDTGSITKNKIEQIQNIKIEYEKLPSRARRKVKDKTIIYSTVRPNQEHYGFIESNNSDLIVSTGFSTIDITDKKIDPKYIYYFLTQKYITEYLHTIAQNSVATYPAINPSDIANLKLEVPDLINQEKISKILTNIDKKIELNNQINAELEAMAKTLYDYWFVQFDFPDENGKPYKSSGGKMVYNAKLKREIPEGCDIKSISDIIEVKDGTHESPKPSIAGHYLITSKHLKGSCIDFSDAYLISHDDFESINKRSKVDEGDFLLSMIGTIGITQWVSTIETPFAIKNMGLFKASANPDIAEYLFAALTSQYGIAYLYQNQTTGTSQPYVTLGTLRSIPILIPSQKMLDLFVKKARPIYSLINNNNQENNRLEKLRDWLLPMLMNGQVSVTTN